MPLFGGSSARTASRNIRVERPAGAPQSQAVAVALAEARRNAKRTNLFRTVCGARVVIEFNRFEATGETYWEAVWKQAGSERAHRRFNSEDVSKAQRAYASFVDEAIKGYRR